jgi:hypothetical protein
MCNRKGARRRRLEAPPSPPIDLEKLKLEGWTPPDGFFTLPPQPYLLRSKGFIVLEEDGLGNASGRLVTTEVFDPPIPMNCN